ncbi:MAG: hypothetical protein HYU66_25700, partial [Armatimonadetes bacterium]|nr:hypothetical protein [Armatimonadota bacterium]
SACPACGFTTFIEVAGPPPAEPEPVELPAAPARPLFRRALPGVTLLLLPFVCNGYSRWVVGLTAGPRPAGCLATAATFLGLICAVFYEVCLWPCIVVGLWVLWRQVIRPPTIHPST